MEKKVSIRDANLHFSRYVREAENGEDIVVTRRGEPVVRMVKETKRPQKRKLTNKQKAAFDHLMKLLRKGIPLGGNAWPGREALYDRGRKKGWG